MSLPPRLQHPVTAALVTTVLVAVLGASAEGSGARDDLGSARPASISAGPAGDAGSRAAEVASHWRTVLAPALHTARPTVVRPVRRVAAPSAGTTVGSIPDTALRAYERAASVLAAAAPSCRLTWTLLAGVGRVESDHGRYGGATLGTDGVSRPLILGVPLNGVGPVAAVRDTDGGILDGDRLWDRAVGPLQFIPSTWAVLGVDADGDGRRSPNDIDDAALGAGVHLCAGTSRLDAPGNARAALLRYNHSYAYASLVLAYADRYATDAYDHATDVYAVGRHLGFVGTGGSGSEQLAAHAGGPVRGNDDGDLTRTDPQAGPTPVHSSTPAPTATGPVLAEPDPGTGSAGAASSRPPTQAPTGDESPAASAPPLPVDASPEAVSIPPAPQVVEGTWTECDAAPCLDGHLLELADAATCEVADYDGDGSTESLATELAGLGGQTVAVTVIADQTGWLVLEIRGLAWPGGTGPSVGPGCPAGAEPSTAPRSQP